MTDSSDSELVSQSLAGNRDAFGWIVARYQSLLCSLAYSATGNLGQSEELAQETFVAAWKQLANLHEPEKLRSWLCRIARNLTYDALRERQREPLHLAEPLEVIEESPLLDPLPSDHTINREEEAILWRSIERIPENYREPLVLFYREHQSIDAVAAALDLSEDAVKQRLSRGRRLLHEQVLAFVEGALERTRPGKAFGIGVITALPAFAVSSKATEVAMTTVKGGTTAKAFAASGLSSAILAPALGFLGNYFGYRVGLDSAASNHEREYINRFYRKLIASLLGFWVAYGLLMIGAKDFVVGRHLVSSSVAIGLVVPFTVVLFASGIFWLRAPRNFLAEMKAKGVTVPPSKPVWEYRSKLALLGLPLVHVRLRGGLAVPALPVKAWIASGDYAIGLLFASGNLAIAPVSIGASAIGLISFGGCAVGLLCLGGFSFGAWSFGAIAFGWQVHGACGFGWHAANGGIAIAHDFAMGSIAHAMQANNPAAEAYFRRNRFFQQPWLLLQYLAWLNLLWVLPMLARWRNVASDARRRSLERF